MVLKNLNNSNGRILFIIFLLFTSNSFSIARQGTLEWKVVSSLSKLEKVPAYMGEKTFFTVKEKPKVKARVIKKVIPVGLSESEKKAMRAADLLNDIRKILSNEDIFNPDVTDINIGAIIKSDGKYSTLIKNRWYNVGGIIDVPIIAKENLKELISRLKVLDPNLAEVVESQVNEKIAAVHNLSLSIYKITKNEVHLVDDKGLLSVIKFKRSSY